jgi:Putative metal-binding motif
MTRKSSLISSRTWLLRRPAAAAAAFLAVAAVAAVAPAAEPAACLSPDPAQWPTPSKPYFMIAMDTSGSMNQNVVPANTSSCTGYGTTRIGHAKCALKNTLMAYSGQVNFGLAAFANVMSGCSSGCYANCNFTDMPGNYGNLSNPNLHGCGPEPDPTVPFSATRSGGYVLVPMQSDDYWNSPHTPSNLDEMLRWVDNDCTNSVELWGKFATASNGLLRDMYRYFSNQWTHPAGSPTYVSPLGAVAQGERACRSVNVIFMTDGDEDCDTDPIDGTAVGGAAADAAAKLLAGFTKGGITWSVKTHVINFAGGSPATTDAIAAAGGTGSSIFAANETQLAAALSRIIAGSVAPESCDNTDNNCNGCTDEGFKHFCDDPPTAGSCCAWTTQAQRTTCLAGYTASISAANPKGDVTKLPCTTPSQQQDPASWLCFDPGERCDNLDNNCQSGVDEGITKCGSPLHCPKPETCNGQDDNCDGLIDEGYVCGATCVPKPEICDGCDNDCDGIVDNGIAPIPCGQASPPNCAGSITCKAVSGTVTPGACVIGGGFNTCSNNPQPETCDNLDNNCNGIVDDGIAAAPCVPQGTPGGLVFGGSSQCKRGTQACGGTCVGFVGPSPEICDGIDNDCDGQVDEGAVGVGQPCGVNQLPCTPGTTACVSGVLVCQGGLQPKPEVCDGNDNDCDGQVDETPLADAPAPGMNGCWGLPGNCCHFPAMNPTVSWCPPAGASCSDNGSLTPPCNKGTLVCSGNGGWTCGNSHPPGAEVCNGIDDNCNGQVDDGTLPQVGQTCGTNVGDCKPGLLACTAGILDCVGDVPPTSEICDGKDNDCDGNVDNGIPTGGPCAAPYDAAAYPGNRTAAPCQPGILQCNGMGGLVCVGGVGPSPERCDGIDNDCDGNVDETGPAPDGINGSKNPLPPPPLPPSPDASIGDPCGVSVGECKQGAYACINGLFSCIGSQSKAPEVCDCLDNDCDGKTDNPSPGGPALCSAGKDCVKSGAQCQCARPCSPQLEFPCPGGQTCVEVTSSETSAPAGFHCVVDPCVDCPSKTVKDGSGKVVCAPAGTTLPGCVTPPVCVCKGQNGCQDPCVGVTCSSGEVCAASGPNAGKCVVDNCFNTPCQGCGKVCNLGSCVDNPCASMTCPAGQACKPSGDFTKGICVGSCADVTCPSGQACVDGACSPTCPTACAAGETCDLSKSPPSCVTSMCSPTSCPNGGCCDPRSGACGNCACAGVVCPDGQSCSEGQCVKGGTSSSSTSSTSTGSAGSTSSTGSETSSSSGSGGEGGAGGTPHGVWGLPTGGGGCACSLEAGDDHAREGRWAITALALALVSAGARRRRRG